MTIGLALIIAFIALALFVILWYFPRQARKEHEDYLKDDRDVTERFYEDEVFPNAFKRKP